MRNLKNIRVIALIAIFSLSAFAVNAQQYRYIKGWSKSVNDRLESFLNSTITMNERKVAVFDCDGTLFGQSPYYLADEALYVYAKEHYAGKSDSISKAKYAIIDDMLHGPDNVGIAYVQKRINFLSGLTPDDIAKIGNDCYQEKYAQKLYPEMKELLANLKEYGIEIWVLTASPEFLMQRFVHEQLGIPVGQILGVKSTVRHGVTTNEIVTPVPQDWGKSEAIYTFIKARPILVGGNSRGDMEMMEESVGIKLIINPDDVKTETTHAGNMTGYTVKKYWEKDPTCIITYCNDDDDQPNINYVCKEWQVKPNKLNPKKAGETGPVASAAVPAKK
jgi:phosphoserine phosphatase